MTESRKTMVCRIAGDKGLLVEFGEGIDPTVNAKVRTLAASVRKTPMDGIIEIIPTYRSLLFVYDPVKVTPDLLINYIETIESRMGDDPETGSRVVTIPVCYGGEQGPDMETVQASAGLSAEEVIRLHSEPEYLIYMVGFTPGFPFLGGLNEKLFTPRLKTPRTRVPQGSVGIANNQTGIYPVASPGGWQIIGRTPLTLFDPRRDDPFLYRAGDKIKFTPISQSQYEQIKQKEVN